MSEYVHNIVFSTPSINFVNKEKSDLYIYYDYEVTLTKHGIPILVYYKSSTLFHYLNVSDGLKELYMNAVVSDLLAYRKKTLCENLTYEIPDITKSNSNRLNFDDPKIKCSKKRTIILSDEDLPLSCGINMIIGLLDESDLDKITTPNLDYFIKRFF